MSLTIATWNINSVRLRIDIVARLLDEWRPDVLCLQETKCPQGQFPSSEFHKRGYTHIAEFGQKGYHGVAIASRHPFKSSISRAFCKKEDCRHISAVIDGRKPLIIHNLYVPAGGDEPDPEVNEKFAHKLKFLDELEEWFTDGCVPHDHHGVVVGDLNIAPLETDVWSHRELLKVVSHTPVETEGLKRVQKAGQWVDVVRQYIPPEEKLYTWWSYRARDWEASDRGRRLDHIWTTPGLSKAVKRVQVLKPVRGWPQPSDHVPIIAEIDWSP